MSQETPQNVTSIDKHLYDETSKERQRRRLVRTGVVMAGVAISALAVMGLERDGNQEAEKRAQYAQKVEQTAEQGGGSFVENGKEISVTQAITDIIVETDQLRTDPVRGDEVDNYIDTAVFDTEAVVLHNPVIVPDARNSANADFIGAQDALGNWYWTGAQELEDKEPGSYQIYTAGEVKADDAVLEPVR